MGRAQRHLFDPANVEDQQRRRRQAVLPAPATHVVIYLYYRQDLFQQANLQPPKTFDEFLAAAKALTKGDMAGFGMRGGAGARIRQLGPVRRSAAERASRRAAWSAKKALAANRW